jgi:DNA-directed RNA polymerase sigma subunit (sigma70/sigma32)
MMSIDLRVDDKMSIGDTLRSDFNTEELAIGNEHSAIATSFLSVVNDIERDVLNRLYVYADDTVTLRGVGADLNVSHERIRQIRNAALNRIRKTDKYQDMSSEVQYLCKEAV